MEYYFIINPISGKINKQLLEKNIREACLKRQVYVHKENRWCTVSGKKIPDEEYLKLMAMTIILRASSTLNKYGTNIYQLASEEEVFQNVREIRTIDDTSECVIKYIKQVIIPSIWNIVIKPNSLFIIYFFKMM